MLCQTGPVVCFSYLAAAELWTVPRFPAPNHGAEVMSVEQSVAADGPMAAAVLAALDVPALLLTNDLGADLDGATVEQWLDRCGVTAIARTRQGAVTPRIVVVADQRGTRTWFPYLPGVAGSLAGLDLSPLACASFAYIDCYPLIEAAALRMLNAARAAQVPAVVNLGGSPVSPAVADAVRGHPRLIIQTNLDDERADDAVQLAHSMLAVTRAAGVVVTAGAAGAVALYGNRQFSVPAFRVAVRHTHCAGAAFSGGLLYGLLRGWNLDESVTWACASGALRCERGHDEPMPLFDELRAVVASGERMATPAAAMMGELLPPIPVRSPHAPGVPGHLPHS